MKNQKDDISKRFRAALQRHIDDGNIVVSPDRGVFFPKFESGRDVGKEIVLEVWGNDGKEDMHRREFLYHALEAYREIDPWDTARREWHGVKVLFQKTMIYQALCALTWTARAVFSKRAVISPAHRASKI